MNRRISRGPLNNRLFIRLLTSYLCILFIPLIITVAIFNVRQAASFRLDALTRAQGALQSAQSLLETWTDTATNLALTVLFNHQTETLGNEMNQIDSTLRSIDYMEMLNSYTYANSIVDSVWVYDTDHDVVYTSEKTQCRGSDFDCVDLNAIAEGISSAQWVDVYVASLPNMYGGAAQNVYYLSYVYPLRKNIEGVSGYIFINIDALVLYQQLNRASILQELVILNTEGIVQSAAQAEDIARPYADPSGLLTVEAFLSTGETTVFEKRDKAIVIGAVRSEPFIVAGVLQSTRYSDAIRITYLYAGLLIVIFLLVGVPVCYFISKRMYHPLAQLIRDFEHRTLHNPSQYKDIVRQTLTQLMDQNIPQASIPEEDPESIFNSLNSLITRYLGDPLSPGSHKLPCYAVVLAQLDEPDQHPVQSEKALPFFEQLLYSLAQKIVRPTHHIYTIAVRSGTVALVLPFADAKDYQHAETDLQNLRSAFATFTKCTLSFALSTLQDNEKAFNHALAEAEIALRWKLFRGLASTIRYDASMIKPRAFVYPRVQINQIFNTLDLQSREELRQSYGCFVADLKQADADVDDIVLVFYQIIGQMLQYIIRRQIPRRKIFKERESSPYRYMNQLETIDHIAAWVLDKLLFIRDQRIDSQPGGSLYINHFQSYMQQNYSQKLDPDTVADTLGISYSYLRKLLSTEMGTSFSSYLAELRVQSAKELLMQTQMSQREIAQRAGFGSEQTFHRVFKAIEGISPGEYRKQMQGKS